MKASVHELVDTIKILRKVLEECEHDTFGTPTAEYFRKHILLCDQAIAYYEDTE